MLFLLLLSLTVNKSNLYLQTNLFNNSVYSDYIYLTTDYGGLVSFDPRDSSWNSVNSVSGLPSNETKDVVVRGDSVFVLSKGGITIFDKELNRIDFQDFNSLFFTDTDPYCIRLYRNKVILGGERGIQRFDLNDFGNLRRVVEHIDYNFQVFEILSLDTCYLLGTSRGVFKADANFRDTVLIDNYGYVYSLLVYGSSIWAGGSWGCKEITADTAVFSDDTVWYIGKIDERIYTATKRGLYRYVGNWQRLHGGDVRSFVRVSPVDVIVAVVRRNGLRFEGSSNYIFPPGLVSNMVTDLTQTPDGKIYVSYKNSRSISVLDGNEWEILNRGNSWGLSGGHLFNMESDSQGRIYFGLWFWQQDDILYCWDARNDTMPEPITLPVPATTISGMLVDNNDDLWIGLFRAPGDEDNWVLKMHRVDEDSLEWSVYVDPEIKWKRVFAEGSAGIYCGNSPTDGGAGIHILREGTIRKVIGNLGSSTLSLASDLDGNIWAGLENSLVYISGENVERVYTSGKVDGLAVDFQGGVWCYNSESGLSYLSPEEVWESLPEELRNLQSFSLEDVVYPLHFIDNNRLFIGTYNGLYEFELNYNYPDSGQINVYPNPFNYQRHNRLYFSARGLGGKNILIFDIVGKIKGNYAIPPEYYEDFWIEKDQLELSSGLYLYYVTDGGRIIHRGKFVVVR
jgi:hypothetical protein